MHSTALPCLSYRNTTASLSAHQPTIIRPIVSGQQREEGTRRLFACSVGLDSGWSTVNIICPILDEIHPSSSYQVLQGQLSWALLNSTFSRSFCKFTRLVMFSSQSWRCSSSRLPLETDIISDMHSSSCIRNPRKTGPIQ